MWGVSIEWIKMFLKNRTAMRGKKWYWCLISYTIDVSINNAWQLQQICNNENPMDMLQFRRYIVRTYLSLYGKLPEKGMRGKPQNVLSDIRYDGYTHLGNTTKWTNEIPPLSHKN